MSFTAEVKDELSRVPATCSHCDKAVLAALVRIEGTLFVSGKNRYRVEIATDAPSVARLVIKLLHELYRLKTNLTVRRSVLHKTPNYLIEVPAQPQLAAALVDMGVLSPEGGLVLGVSEQLVAKDCCAAAYLRGAFLGSGFVSDPRGDFHFEVIVETEELADGLVDLLARKNIKLLWPFSTAMGRDGAGMPRDWLPNDGLVNTISARYPGGAPHADFAPGQTPVRGVWQVLPVEHLDHLAAIGGVMNNGVVRTRLFFRRVMALLDAAAAADANS